MRCALLTICFLLAFAAGAKAEPSASDGSKLRQGLVALLEKSGPDKKAAADRKRRALLELLRLSEHFVEDTDAANLFEQAGLRDVIAPATAEGGGPIAFRQGVRARIGKVYDALADAWAVPREKRLTPIQLEKEIAGRIARLPDQKLDLAMRSIPDEFFLAWEPLADSYFAHVKFSSLPAMAHLKETIKKMNFDGVAQPDIDLLADSLGRYFDHLPADRKRLLALAWLRLPPGATVNSQIQVALDEAGPAVQKLFQLMAGNTKDPAVKSLMSELQANVKPFPGEEALAAVERNLGRPVAEVFSSLESDSFSAGTVGQIHRGRLRADGREVAVKVQRPGIKEKMAADFAALREAVDGNETVLRLLDEFSRHFQKELDLIQEAKNLEEMGVYRDPAKGLAVPKLAKELPLMPEVIVMDLASGKALSRIKDLDPRVKADALHEAIRRWFEEAIFGGGFFHADLHPGNMLLQPLPKQPGFLLTFVDAGSAGRLTLEQRRLMVRFAAAVATRSPELTRKVLGEMGKIPPEKERALRRLIEEALAEPRPSVFHRANEIMIGAMKAGVELPHNYALFSRSMELLQQQMREVNAEILKKFPKARLHSMLGTFTRSILGHAAVDLPRQLVEPRYRDLATVESKIVPEALAGAMDGIEKWFGSRELGRRSLSLARNCSQWFGLLPH